MARHLVVLDRGTEVMPALLDAVRRQGVKTGSIHGIGAFADTRIGFYDVETKGYNHHEVPASMEVVSFLGNITQLEGEPFIHAHVALGGPDFTMIGGHFFNATISVTGEFFIESYDDTDGGEVAHRELDSFTKLKLIARPAGRADASS